jgi:hypothetical protein
MKKKDTWGRIDYVIFLCESPWTRNLKNDRSSFSSGHFATIFDLISLYSWCAVHFWVELNADTVVLKADPGHKSSAVYDWRNCQLEYFLKAVKAVAWN